MKKFICFIVIGVILISSIPIYAENFNDGPIPTNPYFIHYNIYDDSLAIKDKDIYLYFTDGNVKDTSVSYQDGSTIYSFEITDTTQIMAYANGTRDTSVAYGWQFLMHTKDFNSFLISKEETWRQYNEGFIDFSFYHLIYERIMKKELTVIESTVTIKDATGNVVGFPRENIPDYVDESKVWITMGNSNGNNPLATIIVRYKLDQRFIGDLGNWKFKLLSTPDRYMKVVRHTPLDYMYPQPSLFRYGEIEYQGQSIVGQNKFFAQATNALEQIQLTSLPWVYDYYEGFIDDNFDGQDDRFNSGDDSQGAIPDDESLLVNSGALPVRADYEDGILGTIAYFMDLIFTYISTPFTWISKSLTSMARWLAESMSWVTSLNLFFGAIFGFLPEEFKSALLMLLLVTVIFSIISLMRGK